MKKKAVQEWATKKAFDEVVGPRYASSARAARQRSGEIQAAADSAVEYLTEHYHEATVWIAASSRRRSQPWAFRRRIGVSCRARTCCWRSARWVFGSTLTTRQDSAVREGNRGGNLGPCRPAQHSYAILPIGYPMGKFGPTGRGKMSEFVFMAITMERRGLH